MLHFSENRSQVLGEPCSGSQRTVLCVSENRARGGPNHHWNLFQARERLQFETPVVFADGLMMILDAIRMSLKTC